MMRHVYRGRRCQEGREPSKCRSSISSWDTVEDRGVSSALEDSDGASSRPQLLVALPGHSTRFCHLNSSPLPHPQVRFRGSLQKARLPSTRYDQPPASGGGGTRVDVPASGPPPSISGHGHVESELCWFWRPDAAFGSLLYPQCLMPCLGCGRGPIIVC